MTRRVVIVGAGISGLVAASLLAHRGFMVTVLERAHAPGGKMRTEIVGGTAIDAGPTVLTMRWVFDEVFKACGRRLAADVTLNSLTTLARHAWPDGSRLDLFADVARSAETIGSFAGPAEARAYLAFTERARTVYETLEASYIRAAEPTPVSLALGAGISGLAGLVRISPFTTLWKALGEHFKDERLRQLFARYATYCGSSPFLAPATLMLIAHVEQRGVWTVEGGMHALARALAAMATSAAAEFRYAADAAEVVVRHGRVSAVRITDGETLQADAVVFTADIAGLAEGRYGRDVARTAPPRPLANRSLSAVTWATQSRVSGFPLSHHNVFFSNDYAREFDVLARGRMPDDPTIYICAGSRGDGASAPASDTEPLFLLVNAPARGDGAPFEQSEVAACEHRVLEKLDRMGLRLDLTQKVVATPADFEHRFPASGGALYGQATHGWGAAFNRPHARTRLPGFYLAGGGVHPGPGVPMAAISGWLAAATLMADSASTGRSHPVVMPGGMSTR